MATPYIAAAAFRTASLAEFCYGLDLTSTEAPDAALDAAVARASVRFDNLVNDHFDSDQSVLLILRGNGTRLLDLPRRCTGVSSLTIVNSSGTTTSQTASLYRLHSSLNTAGTARLSLGAQDWLEIAPGQTLLGTTGSGHCWPNELNSIRLTGTFGWAVPPAEVKRAIALMVYSDFKPQADVLQQVSSFTDTGVTYQTAEGTTGIPRVDEAIKAYAYNGGSLGAPQVLIG